MKRRAAIAALALSAMSLPVLAEDQAPKQPTPFYLPLLGDLMVTTQLRHFKLWYAGLVSNWKLATYELAQIKATFQETTRLYPNVPEANMTAMMQPADEVGNAIAAKDNAKFGNAFDKLTTACNSCHEAVGFGYIKIRVPRISPLETSPFSDESFAPN